MDRTQEKAGKPEKVAFILHNYPCSGVEGSVGGAANLDSLESVARILNRMQEAGYAVNPLKMEKPLLRLFSRKSNFRVQVDSH